jgi:hypothetical protein
MNGPRVNLQIERRIGFAKRCSTQQVANFTDYIANLKDTADFTIVDGHRDAKDEQELGIEKLWWTSFYIGCFNGTRKRSGRQDIM